MEIDENIVKWLLEADPAIRWQVYRDLLEEEQTALRERSKINEAEWGQQLLAVQKPSGLWGGGLYPPKWISTTYTMLLLRRFGLMRNHQQAHKSCFLLLEKGFYHDGGINYFASFSHSETCVTGMILSLLSYFRFEDDRIHQLVGWLLGQQMPDGGWNCDSFKGATHSSFHTTISVLEGLREYEKTVEKEHVSVVQQAQVKGREFLLMHRLFKSDRTGEIVHSAFTRFSFPPRWHYDILRALDYFQECNAIQDERLTDAIDVLKKKRKKDGRWILQNRHPGRTYFEMEQVGKSSRWNTLRALRVLKWWES